MATRRVPWLSSQPKSSGKRVGSDGSAGEVCHRGAALGRDLLRDHPAFAAEDLGRLGVVGEALETLEVTDVAPSVHLELECSGIRTQIIG